MSERPSSVAIARARSGADPTVVTPSEPVDEATVLRALAEVADPELPMVSITDLGMVGPVTVGSTIRVALLPTYVGCPALEMIRASVEARLAPFGLPVEVVASFDVPWASERISATGLRALADAGIAPPTEPNDARCPYCASERVVLDNVFGPTPCRSLFYCRACRQPFEAIKPV